MNVLGIETSSRQGSVALLADGSLFAFRELAPDAAGGGAGRALAPAIDALMRDARLAMARLDLIAVGLGPGGYTGARLAVATARTLGFALDKPVLGVASTVAIAAGEGVRDGRVVVAIDAKNDDLYVAIYDRRLGAVVEVVAPAVRCASDIAAELGADDFIAGDGFRRIAAHRPLAIGDATLAARADVVARLGAARFSRGERDTPESLLPLYLRVSEAERKFLARRGS